MLRARVREADTVTGEKDHSYDDAIVPRVAELLGASLVERPFTAQGAHVFELRLPNQALNVDVVLTLWPGLGRADARVGDVLAIVKQIGRVTLEPGVEAVFWKDPGPGYLLVTVRGKVSVVG
jgi:hypothetical protein